MSEQEFEEFDRYNNSWTFPEDIDLSMYDIPVTQPMAGPATEPVLAETPAVPNRVGQNDVVYFPTLARTTLGFLSRFLPLEPFSGTERVYPAVPSEPRPIPGSFPEHPTLPHEDATTLPKVPSPDDLVPLMRNLRINTVDLDNGLISPPSSPASPIADPVLPIGGIVHPSPPTVSPVYVVIAHDPTRQHLWDTLAFGTLFEVARMVSHGHANTQSIPTETIEALQGQNRGNASQVRGLLLQQPAGQLNLLPGYSDMSLRQPWEPELDKEQEAMMEGVGRGLGSSPIAGTWYGGKVAFRGSLGLAPSVDSLKGRFRIRLGPPEVGPSYSYGRIHGSRRFLRLKLAKDVLSGSARDIDETLQFALRPLLIFGRVFRSFLFQAKERVIHYMETNENVDRVEDRSQADHLRLSILHFIKENNPLEQNSAQLMCKWVDRFRLGLSTSVPGCVINQERIVIERDIVANSASKNPEAILTDGNGLISASLMRALTVKYGWPATPSVIQFRLAGFKGTLTLSPVQLFDESFSVNFRDSQLKINVDLSPPSKRLLHVLAPSTLSHPASISRQYMIVLSHGGVPNRVICELLKEALTEEVHDLTHMEMSPAGLMRLYAAVEKVGGVTSTRLRRATSGARAMGFGRDRDEASDDEGDNVSIKSASSESLLPWSRDDTSGCPAAFEEILMMALAAGFDIRKIPFLSHKWKEVIKKAINAFVVRFRIPVPKSADGFVIPDPVGVLAPGQISLTLSHPFVDPETGLVSYTVTGDVLVTRHPCMLPTDIQKVRAVNCPELSYLKDVIIFPTEGARSLASMLGGGDYDGDTVTVIWDEKIVNSFRNADPSFADEPKGFKEANFEVQAERGENFMHRIANLSPEDKEKEFQKCLLSPMKDKHDYGKYSLWHETCTYMCGLDHVDTIRLARMFARAIDASKSGLSIKKGIFSRDRQRYDREPPAWKTWANEQALSEKEKQLEQTKNWSAKFHTRPLRKDNILDVLMELGKLERDGHLAKVHRDIQAARQENGGDDNIPYYPDPHLYGPYERIARVAKQRLAIGDQSYSKELEVLKAAISNIWEQHCQLTRRNVGNERFALQPYSVRQDAIRTLSTEFGRNPDVTEIPVLSQDIDALNCIKASLAYALDWDKLGRQGGSTFPWEMAMRWLCKIKAEALSGGHTVTIPASHFDMMVVHRGYTKSIPSPAS